MFMLLTYSGGLYDGCLCFELNVYFIGLFNAVSAYKKVSATGFYLAVVYATGVFKECFLQAGGRKQGDGSSALKKRSENQAEKSSRGTVPLL